MSILDFILAVAVACVPLLAAWITTQAIPWIKAHTTAEQRKNILSVFRVAVEAAEQLGKAGVIENGHGKRDYAKRAARKELRTQRIEMDEETMDEYIEAAVMELRIKQEWGLEKEGGCEREARCEAGET